VAAGAVFKLLVAKDLGVFNDYQVEAMPPVSTGGHTDGPNFQYFIPWASTWLYYTRTPLP
jgi:hypothetical protein